MRCTLVVLLALILGGCGGSSNVLPLPSPPSDVRIVDADTVDIDGTRYRLHGIDAPESNQTCRAWGHTWACGEAATQALVSHAGHLSCSGDSADRYGRVVGVCSSGGQDINAWLVLRGWALAEYSTDYRDQEARARAARRGIHKGEFVRPADRRKGQRLEGDDTLAWFATGTVNVPELADSLLWGTNTAFDGKLLHDSVFGFVDSTSVVAFGDWRASNPNPNGGATWTGNLVARNTAGLRAEGAAHLTVDFQQLSLDLRLSGRDVGNRHWFDIPLQAGAFSADDGSLHGRFYGPHRHEAAGIFNRDGWLGAFGVSR